MFVSPAFGLKKYGDATIKKGHMTVLRGGQNLKFSDSGRTYLILNKDVLKVGDDSFVILKTVQDTIVQMGSNAVFQVRPWKQKKKYGYLRMLYGKAIFKVKKFFVKKKRFNFKIATAVAGVRGTKWLPQVTSTGAMETEVIEGIVGFTPTGRHDETRVPEGYYALNLNTVKPTITAKVPVEKIFREEKLETRLASLPPTSKESVKIENMEFYIINNIVTADEFKESERETVDINENFDKPEKLPPEAKKEAELEAALPLVSPTVVVPDIEEAVEEPDEAFERDFEESEDVKEVEFEAALPFFSPKVVVPDIEEDEDEEEPDEDEEQKDLKDLVDTEEIVEDLTNTINETATDSLEKKGNLSIEFEK